MYVVVAALLAASGAPPPVDVFLDDDGQAPRSVDVDARARDVAARVWVSQWEPRTGQPTVVWLPATPPGARSPRAQGLTAEEVSRRVLFDLAPLYKTNGLDLARAAVEQVHDLGEGAVVVAFTRREGEVPVYRDRLAVVLTHELEPVGVLGALPPHGAPKLQFPVRAETALAVALEGLGAGPDGLGRVALRDGWALHANGARSRRVLYATPSQLEPAWHLELECARGPFTVVVSARDGRLLSREGRAFDAAHSYRVFARASAGTAWSHAPFDSPEGDTTPHATGLPDGWAPAALTPAALVMLDSSGLAPNDPWLPAGATSLSGNNAIAYADLWAPDGRNDPAAGLPRLPDGGTPAGAPLPDGGTTRAYADPFAAPTSAVFDFAYDPMLAPTASNTQSHAAATHAFFVTNWLHDVLRDVGFDERAGNAQQDNLGRGGRQGDPLLVEVNDFAQENGSRFVATADGTSPRMELFPTRPFGRATVTFAPSLAVDAGAGAPPMRPGAWNVTGQVVQVVSVDGGLDVCGPFTNAAALAGRVAFARASGPCGSVAGLDDLVADAGATGLLLQNAFDTREPGITVPTHVLDGARAAALAAALDGGATVTATLERTLATGRPAALDSTLLAHEFGHLLSSRLVGDGVGLQSNQSRGLAEGWSDFLAVVVGLDAQDLQRPNNAAWAGAFAVGGFAQSATWYDGATLDAPYFGLRRFPYSTSAARNALTFRHVVSNVPLPTTAPASRTGGGGPDNAEPHNAGEVWASALWEGATRLFRDSRFPAFEPARRRVLELLVASLKATPVNPTFLEARDALLVTARAMGPGELQAFLDGFAVRGLGLRALAPNRRSLTNAPVAEDFANTGANWAVLDARVLDDTDACDNDGVLDVGETGRLQLTLMNVGARAFTNSRVSLATDEAVLLLGQAFVTVAQAEPFVPVMLTVPAELRSDVFGVAQSRVFFTSMDPLLEQAPVFRVVRVNTDVQASARESFEAGAPGWEFARQDVPWEYQFRVASPSTGLLQGTLFGANAPVAGTSWATTPELRGPATTQPVSFTFTQTYSFEFDRMTMRGWDGAQLQLSVNGGPFTLIPPSAISRTVGGMPVTGYDGALQVSDTNPLSGQQAFLGSAMNQRVTVTLGALQNATFRVRFVIGTDTGGASTGWTIDDVEFTNLSTSGALPFGAVVAHAARCVNKPPVLQPSFPQSVDERTRVTLQPPPVTDPNGDQVTFSWRQQSGPTVMLAGDQFDAPEVRADTQLVFLAIADDGRGGTSSQAHTVVVRNVNRAPTASAGEPQTVRAGATVTLAGLAMDPDGDTLVTRWTQLGGPAVTLSDVAALDATFVAPDVQTPSEVNLELNVSDGPAAATPARVTITVTPKGCGCSSLEGGLGLGVVALMALRRRRR
jgi:hypothetical protein